MKRYYISPKKSGSFVLPDIVEITISKQRKLGAYTASNGTLWTDLNSEKLFISKDQAIENCKSILDNYYADKWA